jgi:hypothetical protein
MTNPKLSLDVTSPDEVVRVLREAAQTFAADACNLVAYKNTGYIWERFARVLDHAAHRCEQVLKQEGW